ncbi:MAG: hypothetical protein WBE18_05215 [Gammaproteobacteria bacterium]
MPLYTLDTFRALLSSTQMLKDAIEKDTDLIKAQDKEGMTLLHHAAMIQKFRNLEDRSELGEILAILFQASGIDFSLQDSEGNTPVHVAALVCEDEITCRYIFQQFVIKAATLGFNFSTLNKKGHSVLHIATQFSYTDSRKAYESRRINNVAIVLENALRRGLDVNVLSNSGSTAFYYAIDCLHLVEANSLLDAGANPLLYRAEERDPFAKIKELIDRLTNAQNEKDKYTEEERNEINEELVELKKLKQKIEERPDFKDYEEARKTQESARILAQGQKGYSGSIFQKPPNNPQASSKDKVPKITLNELGSSQPSASGQQLIKR